MSAVSVGSLLWSYTALILSRVVGESDERFQSFDHHGREKQSTQKNQLLRRLLTPAAYKTNVDEDDGISAVTTAWQQSHGT